MGLLDYLNSWLTGDKPVPVRPREEATYEEDYRRPDDPTWVIRIEQPRPKGLPKKVANFIDVAGISRQQENAKAFIKGLDRALELERDPRNKYDKNAIKVIGVWYDSGGNEYREQLGWVPANVAKDIPSNIAIGATIESMYKPRPGMNAGLRIDIWGPRNK